MRAAAIVDSSELPPSWMLHIGTGETLMTPPHPLLSLYGCSMVPAASFSRMERKQVSPGARSSLMER